MGILGRIASRPSSIPFILFGVGIFFFGVGILNPTPPLVININMVYGVGFFGSGILIGFIQALRRSRKL